MEMCYFHFIGGCIVLRKANILFVDEFALQSRIVSYMPHCDNKNDQISDTSEHPRFLGSYLIEKSCIE